MRGKARKKNVVRHVKEKSEYEKIRDKNIEERENLFNNLFLGNDLDDITAEND